MNTIIYSAAFGMKPTYRLPDNLVEHFDFHCFQGKGGMGEAREVKMLPHKYFPGYDVSIWITAATQLPNNFNDIVEHYLSKGDFIVLPHMKKGNTLYTEAETCIKMKKETYELIPGQIAKYKDEKCPEQEAIRTQILIRKHLKPEIIFFDEAWWHELNLHSFRDQISFPYLAWKYDLKYVKMDFGALDFLKPTLEIK